MSILWCGGEDIDFPFGTPGATTSTTGGQPWRTNYGRCGLVISDAYSNPFPGGAVTTAWLSWQSIAINYVSSRQVTTVPIIGLTHSSSPKAGVFVGATNTNAGGGDLAILSSSDGVNYSVLASTTAYGGTNSGKFDMLVSNFGSATTITVFLNSMPVLTYTGDLTTLGIPAMDTVRIYGFSWNTGQGNQGGPALSEIIVADEDTRTMALRTLSPSAAGTTDQWSGATIDSTTLGAALLSDTNPVYSDTAGQDEQATLTTPPTESWGVKAVKIAARAAASSGAAATKLQLGIQQGGTVGVAAAVALGTSYATVETLDATNPVTAAAWQYTDLSAAQLDLRTSA